LEAGGRNAKVAVVVPVFVAVPTVGASGATASVEILLLGAEGPDSPSPFVAVTVNVYSVPGSNPVTVIGEVVDDAVILPGVDKAV
jgi:hypothetical protein